MRGDLPAQVDRRFAQAFGSRVQEFIMNTRIQAASGAYTRADRSIALEHFK